MGNSNSQENQQYNKQHGAGYVDNNKELQRNIEKLIKSSKSYTYTDTIGFMRQSESDIDFESIREIQQNGGSLDLLNVKPKRQRFGSLPPQTSINKSLSGLKTDITKNDVAFLQSVNVPQKGGCGCTTNNDPKDSPISPNPISYDILKGGSKRKIIGGEEDDDSENKKKNKKPDSDEDEDDDSSSSEEDEGEVIEEDSDEDDEYNSDDEDDDSDGENEDIESSAYNKYSDDTTTESNNFLVISSQEGGKKKVKKSNNSKQKHEKKSKKSSKSSKTKNQSRDHLKEHIATESGDEIIIDYKHLYSSSGDTFHGSDESSDQFGEYRNRNMFRFR
jgi:hypothetical protein